MPFDAVADSIVREEDGTHRALYGPFALSSAFQPIFRRRSADALRLDAFEALIRPSKGDTACSPATFFAAVEPRDRAMVDALCRQLHLRNLGQLDRPSAGIFLNFDPSLFDNASVTALEADRIERLAYRVGLEPDRIVCEITEKKASNRAALLAVVEDFRARGFRIAVDDYGAEDSDIERIRLLRPDIVKFDGEWVLPYMESRAGLDLLREVVSRFRASGIMTLFEGLEENWHVDAALSLKIDLYQGFALARPELDAARFNVMFPPEAEQTGEPSATAASQRPADDEPPAFAGKPQQARMPAGRKAVFGRRKIGE